MEVGVIEPGEGMQVPEALGGGRYRLGSRLGAGGMASVFRCTDSELGVDRAVKLFRRMGGSREKVSLQRLSDEARVMARLDHPRILPVYDIGQDGPWHYVVMELATGGTLADAVERGPMAPQEAVDRMVEVLEAVQLAHDRGVVHRDIKPHNILLNAEGHAWLADWGIARAEDRDQTLTRTHVGMGSMAYMAPEQRQDAHGVGPAADLYAVGATLYQLITAETSVDLFHARPDSPRWTDVPEVLRPILARACALRPQDRHVDAAALRAELLAVRAALPASAVRRVDASIGAAATATATATAEPGTETEGPGPPGMPSLEVADPVVARTRWPVVLAIVVVGVAAVTVPLATRFPGNSAGESMVSEPSAVSGDASPETTAELASSTGDPAADVRAAEAAAPDTVAPAGTEEAAPSGEQAPSGEETPPTSGPGVAPSPPVVTVGSEGPSAALPPPSLPIHGPWRGSLDGWVARLELSGPATSLDGWLTLQGQRGRVIGRYSAGDERLVLEVSGPEQAAGTWLMQVAGNRLDGRVDRAGSVDVMPVHLVRSEAR